MAVLACGGRSDPNTAAAQMRFGVRMAERGLWSEAVFRFQQAQQLAGGSDAEVLNNLAVSSEALGRFDEALDYYRRALQLAPGNRDLKANYDRFVSFYESYRARAEAESAADAAPAAAPAEPAEDAGTPGPPEMPADPLPPVPEEPPPPPPPGPEPGPEPAGAADPPPSAAAATAGANASVASDLGDPRHA
jgi:tetratricopeptide (TPR) repeat protein